MEALVLPPEPPAPGPRPGRRIPRLPAADLGSADAVRPLAGGGGGEGGRLRHCSWARLLPLPPADVDSAPLQEKPLDLSKAAAATAGAEGRRAAGQRPLLPCAVCGKAFDRPSLLNRHMRTHTGERPHACEVCGKRFSTSSSLNTHRRIHSGEKPHACPVCAKRFTASSNLYYHRMTHSKEKPHKCGQCAKSFPTPGDLKAHAYTHTGSWPFRCAVCGRGFSKQTNLRNHLFLHTGNRPHTCLQCGKKFALACNLRAHNKTHQNDHAEITKSQIKDEEEYEAQPDQSTNEFFFGSSMYQKKEGNVSEESIVCAHRQTEKHPYWISSENLQNIQHIIPNKSWKHVAYEKMLGNPIFNFMSPEMKATNLMENLWTQRIIDKELLTAMHHINNSAWITSLPADDKQKAINIHRENMSFPDNKEKISLLPKTEHPQ